MKVPVLLLTVLALPLLLLAQATPQAPAAPPCVPGGEYVCGQATPEMPECVTRPNAPEFGACTVAVQTGREIWIGSFRGDHILVVPAP